MAARKPIPVRLSISDIASLDLMAQELKTPRSTLIRAFVRQALRIGEQKAAS